jgi:hypothetical protein
MLALRTLGYDGDRLMNFQMLSQRAHRHLMLALRTFGYDGDRLMNFQMLSQRGWSLLPFLSPLLHRSTMMHVRWLIGTTDIVRIHSDWK